MLVAGFQTGQAFVQVLPSLRDFGNKTKSEVKSQLAGLDVKVPVGADLSRFNADLATAKGKLSDFDGQTATAKIGGDGASLAGTLDRANAALSSFDGKTAAANLGADAGGFDARLSAVEARLSSFDGSTASANLGADAAGFDARLSAAEARLASFNGRKATAKVELDDPGFTRAASAAIRLAQNITAAAAATAALGSAVPAVAALGAALVSAAGAAALLPAALGGVGAAVGTVALGFGGIGDAFTQMGKQATSSGAAGVSAGKQHAAALERVRSAQSALAQAQEQADRAAVTSAQQVAAAQQGLTQAREQASRAAVDAARQVASAEQALADARSAADRQAIAGARQVADARRAVADAVDAAARRQEAAEATLQRAQVSARDAQEALTRAREDATAAIEDLSLALSGAALDEESAQIRLARAQESLAKLSQTGGSVLDFREARLSVQQASQALLETRERYQDLRQEAAKTSAAGVEGSDQVVAAQRRVTDANRAVEDAQKGVAQAQKDGAESVAAAQRRLADVQESVALAAQDSARAIVRAEEGVAVARENARRSAVDSARSIAAAQDNLAKAQQQAAWSQQDSARQVADAQRQLAQAMQDTSTSGAASVDKLAQAMAKLSPNARDLVNSIWSLKPAWDALRLDVQDRLLAGVGARIVQLAGIYLPKLHDMLGGIADAFNRAFHQTADLLATQKQADKLGAAFSRVRDAVSIAAEAVAPLTRALLDVFTVGAKFLPGLTRGFVDLAQRFSDFIHRAAEDGRLHDWIQQGVDQIKQFGRIIRDLGVIVFEVFGKAGESGAGFLDTVEQVTASVRRWVQSPIGQSTLATFFTNLRDTVDRLKPGLEAIWDALTGAIREIAPRLPGVADSFSRIATNLAPILKNIAVALFDAAASAFEVLSHVPAPVLVAAAGLFQAIGVAKKAAKFLKELRDTFTALKAIKNFLGVTTALRGIGSAAAGATRRVAGLITKLGKVKMPAGVGAAGRFAGAAGGIGAGILAADAVLPENVGGTPGNAGQQARDDLKGWADGLKGLFSDPLGELGRQWDDFWGEIGQVPAGFDQSPFMAFWRGIPNWWRDEVWGPLTTGASEKWAEFTGWWDGITADFSAGWSAFWGGNKDGAANSFDLAPASSEKWAGFKSWWDGESPGWKARWDGFWDGVSLKVSNAWDAIKTWVQTKWGELTGWLSGQWETFKANWGGFWDTVGRKVAASWDAIKKSVSDKWNELYGWLQGQWNGFKATWNGLWDTVSKKLADAWETIKRVASAAWTWLRDSVWRPLADFVSRDIPAAFDRAVAAIRTAWDKIREIAAAPARFVINTVYNDGIRPMWNAVAGIVSLPQLPDRRAPFATGGPVYGAGTATSDSIPALLSNGEHVWTAAEVKAVGGHEMVLALRAAALGGHLPGFARGGPVGIPAFALGGAVPSLGDLLAAWNNVTAKLSSFATGSTMSQGIVGLGKTLGQGAYDFVKGKLQSYLASLVSVFTGGGAPPAGSGAVVAQVQQAANALGWGGGPQWDALSWIISHESGWNPNAQNPTSTAYGLFQFLNGTWGTVGGSKTSNPYQQAVYGLRYIQQRYRDPIGARSFWQSHGWYDSGGWLPPGVSTVVNGTGKPEAVLTERQWATLSAAVRGGDTHNATKATTINVEVNNPVAEPTSASVARELRTIAAMARL